MTAPLYQYIDAVFVADLPSSAKVIAVCLRRMQGSNDATWPKCAEIQARTGMKRSAVLDGLAQLRAAGFVEAREDRRHMHAGTVYVCVLPTSADPDLGPRSADPDVALDRGPPIRTPRSADPDTEVRRSGPPRKTVTEDDQEDGHGEGEGARELPAPEPPPPPPPIVEIVPGDGRTLHATWFRLAATYDLEPVTVARCATHEARVARAIALSPSPATPLADVLEEIIEAFAREPRRQRRTLLFDWFTPKLDPHVEAPDIVASASRARLRAPGAAPPSRSFVRRSREETLAGLDELTSDAPATNVGDFAPTPASVLQELGALGAWDALDAARLAEKRGWPKPLKNDAAAAELERAVPIDQRAARARTYVDTCITSRPPSLAGWAEHERARERAA